LSRTVSARIPTELHEELRERCNLIGESINDFVKASIELMLRGSVDFDFGNELLDKLEEERKGNVIHLGSNNSR
jgi:predicted DNA-binding protein